MFQKVQKNGNKVKQKKDLKEIFSGCKSRISKLHLSTWYFSVSFFVIIFFVSLWVWWVGFYQPEASRDVVTKFESTKENFEAMKSSTETAIELLKSRQDKVKNTPDFSGQRDLFVDRRELEIFEAEEKRDQTQSEGDQLQQTPGNSDSLQ